MWFFWIANAASAGIAYFVGKKVEEKKIENGASSGANILNSGSTTLILGGVLAYLILVKKKGF